MEISPNKCARVYIYIYTRGVSVRGEGYECSDYKRKYTPHIPGRVTNIRLNGINNNAAAAVAHPCVLRAMRVHDIR